MPIVTKIVMTKVSRIIKLRYINLLDKIGSYFPSKLIYVNKSSQTYIYENIFFRWLSFASSAIQSKVCKVLPAQPVLNTSKVLTLAGVIYKNHTNQACDILVLGLGGGDIVRSYYKLFTNASSKTDITAIDQSQEIINIANKYFYLNKFKPAKSFFQNNKYDNITLKLIHDDAISFINNLASSNIQKYSIIVVDFFTALDSAIILTNDDYIQNLLSRLNPNGIIAFNLLLSDISKVGSFITSLKKYCKNIILFKSQTLYNTIVYAYHDKTYNDYITSHPYVIKQYSDQFDWIVVPKQASPSSI